MSRAVFPGERLQWVAASSRIAALLNKHNNLVAPLKAVYLKTGEMCFYEEAFGEILATCSIEFPRYPNKSIAKIEHLVVDERYRKLGFGAKIVERAIEYLDKVNIRAIFATIRKSNLPSINLFSKLGFSMEAEIQGNEEPLIVAIRLNKHQKEQMNA